MGNIYPDDAFALVDDTGTVLQFVSFYGNTIEAGSGPAAGMNSTMIGTPGEGESLQSQNGGSSYFVQSSPNRNTIPCFAGDTSILTPNGNRHILDLRVGDEITTADNGPQPIRWLRCYRERFLAKPKAKRPVRIKAGALGQDSPQRDLILSPHHRVVIQGAGQRPNIKRQEMLAPAKSLTDLPRVSHDGTVQQMTWVHFALDHHEVVFANGAAVETLLLSDLILSSIPRLQRTGLLKSASRHRRQFGKIRPVLKVSEARKLIRNSKLEIA